MKIEWTPQEVYEELLKHISKLHKKKKITVLISDKETKEMRTLAQNRTWYKLFNWIAVHLWLSKQEVKIYFLIWCFWSKKLQLSKEIMDIPIISETHLLTKDQGIFLIDTLISFTKIKNIPIEITSKELDNLYATYEDYE